MFHDVSSSSAFDRARDGGLDKKNRMRESGQIWLIKFEAWKYGGEMWRADVLRW